MIKTLDLTHRPGNQQRRIDPVEPMTTAFRIKEGEWRVCWRGQVPSLTFTGKGAAEAYLVTCDAAGKLRS